MSNEGREEREKKKTREGKREGKRLDLLSESVCKYKRLGLLLEVFLVAEVWRREDVNLE